MKLRLFETARGAIGQANINATELRSFALPVPPVDLQREFQRQLITLHEVVRQQAKAEAREAWLSASIAARLLG